MYRSFVKRALDILLSAVVTLLLSPLFLLISCAVKAEDGGPVFFTQKRIGIHKSTFNILKFRTMKVDAEAQGPALYGGDDDPRLTKVGKFLRVHHLDELPQLWNVLKGDMSFVGPRPERKFYIDKIIKELGVTDVPDFISDLNALEKAGEKERKNE